MSSIDHLLATSYRYDVMGPRVSAARKQLETRIRNDEIYRESERKLTKDFERKLNNWWRLRDEPSILRRAKREEETMKREIEAARKATVRMRRAALRAMVGRESAQYDQELRKLHDKAFYKRRQ